MSKDQAFRPSRRALLGTAAASAATWAAAGAGPAAAQSLAGTTVVFASYGGSYQDAERVSYCDPFAAETGARVVQAGPMNLVRFRTMSESGTPDWDVVDITINNLMSFARDNLLEKIDTGIVDTSRIDPQFVHEYGVGCIVWSYNLGYNTRTFPQGKRPTGWADLFDLKRFPGKRTLIDGAAPNLEVALLADGVAPSELYPLDVDRAFRKLDSIKAQTVFWSTNSQSQQLFVDEEVSMGLILNGRAYDASKKGAEIAVSWEQNIQSVDYLVVPRGSRNRAAAMKLIDTMTKADNQAKLANLIAYAPTNPAAFRRHRPGTRQLALHLAGEQQARLRHRRSVVAGQRAPVAGALGGVEARLMRAPRPRPWLLLLPAVGMMLCGFALPVGMLLARAFTQPEPGLQNFAILIERPVYLQVLWNTVLISAVATPIALLFGYPVAHAMAHAGPGTRRLLTFVVLLPFWTSLLVRSFATVILFQRRGPLNQVLMAVGITDAPLPLIYNLAGVLLGAVQTLLPFVIFPLYASMRRIDPALMPAAMTMGATPVRAFLRVYLPLSLPGLMTGATLTFISMLGYFVIPAMLGGPRETMLAQLIQDQVAQLGSWGVAGALSLVLLAVTAVLLGTLHRVVGLKAVAR